MFKKTALHSVHLWSSMAEKKTILDSFSTASARIRSVLSPSAPAELNTSNGHSADVKSGATDEIMKDTVQMYSTQIAAILIISLTSCQKT